MSLEKPKKLIITYEKPIKTYEKLIKTYEKRPSPVRARVPGARAAPAVEWRGRLRCCHGSEAQTDQRPDAPPAQHRRPWGAAGFS